MPEATWRVRPTLAALDASSVWWPDVALDQIQQMLGPTGSSQVAQKQQSRLKAGFVCEA